MDYVLMGKREARRLGLVEAAIRNRITNQEGADALGISLRQFKRLRHAVRLKGAIALVHGNRGRVSPRRLPEKLHQRIQEMLTQPNVRLNDCHLADLLQEEGWSVSPDSVRRARVQLGLPAKKRRRPRQHHGRRQREARGGALVQIDGSPFPWLGDAKPDCCLVGAIDDAQGTILGLTFRPHEDLHGFTEVLRQICVRYGVPLALYGDKTNILVRNDPNWSLEEELQGHQHPSHFGQMLRELGIHYIPASSPQAKGRIERLWATLQDRLAAELRLKGITTHARAESYLPSFIERFNRRFGQTPREARSAWRRPPQGLDRILACRYVRIVARDNTVSLYGRTILIPPGSYRRSYQGRRVELRELLDGRLVVLDRDRVLVELPGPAEPFTLYPRHTPARKKATTGRASPKSTLHPHSKEEKPIATRHIPVPSPDHPWRRLMYLPDPHSRER